MNFELFDDDFDESKSKYKKEILTLSKNLVLKNMEDDFKKFVTKNLTCTRNYFILLFALKTIENVEEGESFEMAPISAFTFLPDTTFFQTMCMVIRKYLKHGEDFADYFNVKLETPSSKYSKVKKVGTKATTTNNN